VTAGSTLTAGHTPGECECMTCGYPCLRPEGHATWCALASASSPATTTAPAGWVGAGELGAAGHLQPVDGGQTTGRFINEKEAGAGTPTSLTPAG